MDITWDYLKQLQKDSSSIRNELLIERSVTFNLENDIDRLMFGVLTVKISIEMLSAYGGTSDMVKRIVNA